MCIQKILQVWAKIFQELYARLQKLARFVQEFDVRLARLAKLTRFFQVFFNFYFYLRWAITKNTQ